MTTSGSVAYLDSSAIVKLIVEETETVALRAFLEAYPEWVSSILARVEVSRAVRLYGTPAAQQADLVLRALSSLSIMAQIAELAGRMEPPRLRSIDAIHLATAAVLGPALGVLVTYDIRMASAARHASLPVASPV